MKPKCDSLSATRSLRRCALAWPLIYLAACATPQPGPVLACPPWPDLPARFKTPLPEPGYSRQLRELQRQTDSTYSTESSGGLPSTPSEPVQPQTLPRPSATN